MSTILTTIVLTIMFVIWLVEGFSWASANVEKYKAKQMTGDIKSFWWFILRGGPFTILVATVFLPLLIIRTIRLLLRRK